MDSLQVIRLWAGAAWADGRLHPQEAAALQRLIDASDDLTPKARQEAMGYLEADPQVDPQEVRALSAVSRQGVYRAVLQIVVLDDDFADGERRFLERLRGSLDLDPQTVARIETE